MHFYYLLIFIPKLWQCMRNVYCRIIMRQVSKMAASVLSTNQAQHTTHFMHKHLAAVDYNYNTVNYHS